MKIIEAQRDREGDRHSYYASAGRVFHLLKEFEWAESHYRRAMELDPVFEGCCGWLGLAYFEQGRIVEATPLLRKSISQNPHQRRVRATFAKIDFV